MHISSWPPKKLQQTNRQEAQDRGWVFIRPPGISEGKFQRPLRIDYIWFCKVLLLFTIETKTDVGIKSTHVPLFLCWRSTKDTDVVCIYMYIYIYIYIAYFTHNVYCTYYSYSDLIVHGMGG
jgi:hypothetical protein